MARFNFAFEQTGRGSIFVAIAEDIYEISSDFAVAAVATASANRAHAGQCLRCTCGCGCCCHKLSCGRVLKERLMDFPYARRVVQNNKTLTCVTNSFGAFTSSERKVLISSFCTPAQKTRRERNVVCCCCCACPAHFSDDETTTWVGSNQDALLLLSHTQLRCGLAQIPRCFGSLRKEIICNSINSLDLLLNNSVCKS